MSSRDHRVEEALQQLEHLQLLMSMRPIYLHHGATQEAQKKPIEDELDVFDEMQPWDRSSVEVHISEPNFELTVTYMESTGDEEGTKNFKILLLFSGNDYLGLGSHPTIGKAASKAALQHGMGPRVSALICGYTDYHRRLESGLADLQNKEDCLLCPTGFAANVALMVALGSVGSLLAADKTPLTHEKVAIFSDALNHVSIIDGIRLAQRQKSVEIFIYRHCDMTYLNDLLSSCTMRKKAVVTDSLFSMDGDFAPMIELVKIRKEHDFLLVIDDVTHGTFVCGKNGGGSFRALLLTVKKRNLSTYPTTSPLATWSLIFRLQDAIVSKDVSSTILVGALSSLGVLRSTFHAYNRSISEESL
ncbi:PREDICTED: 8-amino-7-oxononanoate synthase-like [Prunus mume]|uniref:8-amino-7-oxononanoate synthase-like n=1 Tax=Prunus mume TaxID=102107 RepID=A0ABM1LQY3_PRUMU|nr:PREDICTED: 8-amino-7-oxononanoate synthase-like [Prunus mume]